MFEGKHFNLCPPAVLQRAEQILRVLKLYCAQSQPLVNFHVSLINIFKL